MYSGYFYDLKLLESENLRTKHKQVTSHTGQCNRVFKTGKPDPLETFQDKLDAAKKHRTLFLGSQDIYKPIRTLRYKCNPGRRFQKLPCITDYNFKIPFSAHHDCVEHPINVQQKNNSQTDPSILAEDNISEHISVDEINEVVATLEPPVEYVYPVVQGYNSFDPTCLGWKYYYEPIQHKICIQSPDPRSVDSVSANDHGTTLKHYLRRTWKTSYLTCYNDKPYRQPLIPKTHQIYLTDTPDFYTSDETQRVEYRSHKRNPSQNSSIFSSKHIDIKRPRQAIDLLPDSPIAGPNTK
ncbi:hypothetical protein C1646_768740 [Rhizophagus diaphanus]|nr:hypothetical protein C1646_768740 [Rhizophagus diaphanus] [Rhizophagus sp. MUCL 43196]